MANLWHQRFLALSLPTVSPQRLKAGPPPSVDTNNTYNTLALCPFSLWAPIFTPSYPFTIHPFLLLCKLRQQAPAICGLLWQPHVNTHHSQSRFTATIVHCTGQGSALLLDASKSMLHVWKKGVLIPYHVFLFGHRNSNKWSHCNWAESQDWNGLCQCFIGEV